MRRSAHRSSGVCFPAPNRLARAGATLAAVLVGVGLVSAGGGSAARAATARVEAQQLYGWISSTKHPEMGISRVEIGGPLVARLRRGTYKLYLTTRGPYDANFHLVCRGLDRRTPPGVTEWTIRLRAGVCRYFSDTDRQLGTRRFRVY